MDEEGGIDTGVTGDVSQRGRLVSPVGEELAGNTKDRLAGVGGAGAAAGPSHRRASAETMATKVSSRLAGTTSSAASRPFAESRSLTAGTDPPTRSTSP